MDKKKIIKIGVFLSLGAIVMSVLLVLYMFNKPHRDIQSQGIDYSISASEIVTEYLNDKEAANAKYLSDDGESKILGVSGTVSQISENFNGQKVVLLKKASDNAGVSATFTQKTNASADVLQIGQQVVIKGVIRSGASYDEDLELYEHVIIEKSDIIQ